MFAAARPQRSASPAFCTTPDEVHDFIAYAVAHYNVDPKRVYVTGLSCGAFGTWEYLAKYGDEQVAAAVPYRRRRTTRLGDSRLRPWIGGASGPSTASSTMSSTRRAASRR